MDKKDVRDIAIIVVLTAVYIGLRVFTKLRFPWF
jgi:hypothetical protein